MFEYKDINDLTEKELIQLIGHNIIEATFSRKKIDNMKKAANKSSNCRINFDKNKRNKKEIQQKKIDTSFEDEIEFYLENIKKVDNEELINSLPSRNNGNYKRIMIRLQAECLKEIKEINEIIESELDNLHEEDLKYIQGEVSIYKEKISIIKNELERNDLPEFIEEKDEIKNRLVFLTTEKGNVKALDDLKNIPREYYFSIEELFLSIINGTFKNVKPFTNNNVLVGIAEVKNFKT